MVESNSTSTPQSAPPLELDELGGGAMQRLRPPPPAGLDLSAAIAHKAITPEDDLLTAQGQNMTDVLDCSNFDIWLLCNSFCPFAFTLIRL